MKRSYFLLVIMSLALLLSGCVSKEQQRGLDTLKEYSIADLTGFFEKTIANNVQDEEPNEMSVEIYQPLLFDESIALFDSYLLRSLPCSDGVYLYSVYRVKEGGAYYVRWSSDKTGSPCERVYTDYLMELPSARNLKRIRKGDTYRKLEEIDKNVGLTLRMGRPPIAYSLASNGTVYGFVVDYQESTDEYIIIDIQDYTNKEVFLSMILKEDYP